MRILLYLLFSSTLLCCSLLGCASESPTATTDETTSATTSSSHMERVLERGKLEMLCFPKLDGPYVRPRVEVLSERGVPLTELHDPAGYAGSDVDLMRGFAEHLGVDLRIQAVTTSYQDLVQALIDERGDLIASSLTITESREEILDFSIPTETIWAVIAVPKDSPIQSLEDLAGLRGAVMRGSSHHELLTELAPDSVEPVLTDFSLENYEKLVEGEADFLIMDSKAEIGQAPEPPLNKAKVVLRLKETSYGIAIPSGSDLKAALDAYIEESRSLTALAGPV